MHLKKLKTLLISIDGLRGDFQSVYSDDTLQNLKTIAKEGCCAVDVLNQFCTLTLPNHFSIVTGLNAENHGFVSNCMFDPEMEDFWCSWKFHEEHKSEDHEKKDKVHRWWNYGLSYPGEPIWQTVTKHDGKSGIYEWPAGCGLLADDDTTTKVVTNTYGKKSIFERVDDVVSWLVGSESEAGCDFVAFYVRDAEKPEHDCGPFGTETIKTMKTIDSGIGYLVDELKKKDLWNTTNLVITSDHGVVEVDPEKVVLLDRFVDKHLYLRKDLSFWPIGCSTDSLYARLSTLPHCQVYWRHELSQFHYSEHHRIAPVIVVPDPGGLLIRQNEMAKTWAGTGSHGYNPYHCPEMRPPLMCVGPCFKKEHVIPQQIYQTDIYLLLCHALGLRPAPCNGDIAHINDVLVDP